ncbi:hypothetical protein DV515_00000342, partial [Chloebia gouldiae]
NNFTDIKTALAAHLDSAKIPKARRKRYISQNDMIAILDYHNQVRGKVFPPASNMEYMVILKISSEYAVSDAYDEVRKMPATFFKFSKVLLKTKSLLCRHGKMFVTSAVQLVAASGGSGHTTAVLVLWAAALTQGVPRKAVSDQDVKESFPVTGNKSELGKIKDDDGKRRMKTQGTLFCQVWDETLAKSAEAWAATCIWDHGPSYLLRFLGQNLSVRTGRYRSILQLVKPWYDEVKDYAFPYPQDCNPRCPMRCYGPMCTHYTQMVWATSNRIGCAIHTCHNMNVWGSVWRRAVYLVCNYAPKGNWIGEAPYKVGVPCSACPPSYGGSCIDNLCFPGVTSNYLYWFK